MGFGLGYTNGVAQKLFSDSVLYTRRTVKITMLVDVQQTSPSHEVVHSKEVQVRNSAFLTFSAMISNDVLVDLMPLNCVNTISPHFTDYPTETVVFSDLRGVCDMTEIRALLSAATSQSP